MTRWTLGAARRNADRTRRTAETRGGPGHPARPPTGSTAGAGTKSGSARQKARAEMGPWEQKEALRARITELDAVVEVLATSAAADPERRDVAATYAANARAELTEARGSLAHLDHPSRRRGAHLGVAQSHVDAALNLMVWMASVDDIKALLPQIVALVDDHLQATDPRRVRVTEIARRLELDTENTLRPGERALLAETVSVARQMLRKEQLRVRSFVHVVAGVTIGLTIAVLAIAVATVVWESLVPMCFTPDVDGGVNVVCPTNSELIDAQAPIPSSVIGNVANDADYLVIEAIGMVAAAIAAAAALRRIRGTSLPYDVPVVLALLKLPTGALTAVLGLLLMRGGFVPGLSSLDSTAQIIAWAIVFGYSQQLFTRYIDSQGQALLDAVRGPAGAPPGPPQAPPVPVK
ncbi:hypothetical protein ABT001_29965 [Streptomyces sp. NPDC002793]|uniref:hypothetical protein n=1 Tax=Streptomyces sp. NPDC002793 TaxID=3154432 RepID=UPI00331CA72B